MPRDLELDDGVLWECFARSFDAYDPKTGSSTTPSSATSPPRGRIRRPGTRGGGRTGEGAGEDPERPQGRRGQAARSREGLAGARLTSPTRERGVRSNPSLARRAGRVFARCVMSFPENEGELARIDREWDRERERYMVHRRNGRRYVPSAAAAVVMGVLVVGFGLFWTVMTLNLGADRRRPSLCSACCSSPGCRRSASTSSIRRGGIRRPTKPINGGGPARTAAGTRRRFRLP